MLKVSEDNQKILNSNTILTGNLNVIRFPEVTDIFVSCNIEICKGNCNSKCHPPFKIDPQVTTAASSEQPSSSDLKETSNPVVTTSTTFAPTLVDIDPENATSITVATNSSLETDDTVNTSVSPSKTEITTTDSSDKENTTPSIEISTTVTDNPSISKETTQNYENRFEKRRLLLKTKSLGKKLDYNHNGLIMNGVDNSTIVLLAKIQAREQKRSLSSAISSPSSKFKLKPTRSLIDNYLKNRIKNRAIRQNRSNFRNSIVIEQPNESLARITINENKIKENSRQARLLLKDQDKVVLDHLVLTKSFVLNLV